MRLFAGISYALSFVIATWVGLRLLRTAARTHKAPELGIGLTVFTLGFGTAGMLGGELVAAGGRIVLGQLLAIGGLLLVAIGAIGLYVAMRQVYRPNSAWTTAGVAVGSTLMIGAFMPRGWFRRLAERFDANAAQRPVDASGAAKEGQA